MYMEELIKACDALIEYFKHAFKSLREFSDLIDKGYRLPKKYFKSAKNRWKRCNTRNLYKVEQKIQKNLPYQRRNY